MGNTWKGISDDDLSLAEMNLLKRAGLKQEDIKFHNVRIDEEAWINDHMEMSQNFIHCVEINSTLTGEGERKSLPIMVLVHGYGAGGGVFFKVLKDLSQYFHLYVVDMLGMGASGRPQYNAFSVDLAEDFFVNSLKIWKEKMGISEKFYLSGHSLGGYISSVYALRHPEDLIKLILLSPVGVPEKPETFSHDEVAQRFDTIQGRLGARVVLKLWEYNFTPFGPLRFTGSMGAKAFLKFYVARNMKSITHEEEVAEMKAYLHQIFLRPASGEYALHTILSPGSWAQSPLIYRLPAIQVPIAFFYGEVDWMDPVPALSMIENKMIKGGLHIVEGAGHHLYLDNPTDMVYKMLLEIMGEDIAQLYLASKSVINDREEGEELKQNE